MKIKYRNEILSLNNSRYCIDCGLYEYGKANRTCFGLCVKVNSDVGFNMTNDCEILEL